MEGRRVVVVGAGLSGLFAAQLLSARGAQVVVVEASDCIGGRIKQADGLVPWPVELGPEFVHGEKSMLVDLFQTWGWTTRELEWPDVYYFADSKRTCSKDDESKDIKAVHALFEELPATLLEHRDILHGMKSAGATKDMIEVAEVCYANDFGASLRMLGPGEMKQEAEHWNYGWKYLLLDRSLRQLIRKLAHGLDVRLSWQATHIQHGTDVCEVTSQRGTVLKSDAVVVTVPLSILQGGDVAFSPALPPVKLGAIGRIGMSNAIKVIAAFEGRFWPEHFWDACCPYGFLPEVWATEYPADGAGTTKCDGEIGRAVVVGFVAGDRADEIGRMAEIEVKCRFLLQLDEMFGSAVAPKPASSSLTGFHIKDWSKEPFIRGAYTYPTAGALAGDRASYAAPVGRQLFFAGEGTHLGCNACMQGALETGQRAADEVFVCLGHGQDRSKM